LLLSREPHPSALFTGVNGSWTRLCADSSGCRRCRSAPTTPSSAVDEQSEHEGLQVARRGDEVAERLEHIGRSLAQTADHPRHEGEAERDEDERSRCEGKGQSRPLPAPVGPPVRDPQMRSSAVPTDAIIPLDDHRKPTRAKSPTADTGVASPATAASSC
jgi:hypothetical protein